MCLDHILSKYCSLFEKHVQLVYIAPKIEFHPSTVSALQAAVFVARLEIEQQICDVTSTTWPR